MNNFEDLKSSLEFDKILEIIGSRCFSELGKARLRNSHPLTDPALLAESLESVSEAVALLTFDTGMPVWAFGDVRILLNKIEPEDSYLEPDEFQEIQNLLEIARELTKFFSGNEDKYPVLRTLGARLDPLDNLVKSITSTIEASGTIYDNASPELRSIRQQIGVVTKQIHIRLERILNKQAEHLQENFITLREGRLVLPVREFSVKKVPGIVHGQSASGQTHYIEPFTVVALNNEMHELYVQEKKEIIRILKRLSSAVRSHNGEITINLDVIVSLDVIQAKAQYARSVDAIAPVINDPFHWEIINGYHPLLLKRIGKEATPVSLSIGDSFNILVITGPNAGGKTVTLKTVGLLQLMFQSGFHIPVDKGSRFPLCQQIFAVIGDEQSIENDLSTFSSHITKLNDIDNTAADGSLMLIDEIGTGTDPSEGAALAIAFLERLNRKGRVTMVTTHLGDLKVFAQGTDGVENAAMEFDRQTLSPRFRLETGIPGSSYAFEISRRLGVAPEILDRARDILGSEQHDLEEMIGNLTEIKQAYEDRLAQLSIRETEVKGLQALYNTRAEELRKKKKSFEREAYESAQHILSETNKTIENIIREIRESQAGKKEIREGKARLASLRQKMAGEAVKPPVSGDIMKELEIGKTVRSIRLRRSGQIIKIFTDRREVELETNGIKVTVPFDDLQLSETPEIPVDSPHAGSSAGEPVPYEIDLRGKIGDEALLELEKYLDAARLSNWKEIRIIHGKGTGALRQRIHQYLRKLNYISSFRLGGYGEGDSGVTIVEL
jgi:DNA mismatch repair protein MutS2